MHLVVRLAIDKRLMACDLAAPTQIALLMHSWNSLSKDSMTFAIGLGMFGGILAMSTFRGHDQEYV